MKYLSFVFLLILFTACKHTSGDLEITGTATGVTFGNVIVRDLGKNPVFRTDIEGGKFKIKEYLQAAGYYTVMYASSATKGGGREVEVYLEPGAYTFSIDTKTINDYPNITSPSEIQKQLSAYNAIRDTMRHQGRQKVVAINNQMKAENDADIKSMDQLASVNKMQIEELKANQVDELAVFNAFIAKYPDSEIAAHILKSLDYQNDPVTYYKIFQKFSDVAKNSADGKEIEGKLKELSKLAPGAQAPEIAGTTADGKPLDIKSLHKKIILLDFWRSTNGSSRTDHQDIVKDLLPQLGPKGFGVISVSLDTDKEKWLAAIKLDDLNWTQISDLKGDDSPNGATWGIKSIPTYYLLDGNGKIINRIAEFVEVQPAIEDYLKSH